MKWAVILKQGVAKDVIGREATIAALRKVPGVTRLDVEMAANGLVLADGRSAETMDALKNVEGVEGVETMGIKSVLGVSTTS